MDGQFHLSLLHFGRHGGDNELQFGLFGLQLGVFGTRRSRLSSISVTAPASSRLASSANRLRAALPAPRLALRGLDIIFGFLLGSSVLVEGNLIVEFCFLIA